MKNFQKVDLDWSKTKIILITWLVRKNRACRGIVTWSYISINMTTLYLFVWGKIVGACTCCPQFEWECELLNCNRSTLFFTAFYEGITHASAYWTQQQTVCWTWDELWKVKQEFEVSPSEVIMKESPLFAEVFLSFLSLTHTLILLFVTSSAKVQYFCPASPI